MFWLSWENAINLDPVFTEELSPEEYIKLDETEKDDIRSVRIIPPKVGDKNFGRILVARKTPVYTLIPHRRKANERRAR